MDGTIFRSQTAILTQKAHHFSNTPHEDLTTSKYYPLHCLHVLSTSLPTCIIHFTTYVYYPLHCLHVLSTSLPTCIIHFTTYTYSARLQLCINAPSSLGQGTALPSWSLYGTSEFIIQSSSSRTQQTHRDVSQPLTQLHDKVST
jgi:hypothetical protein